MDDRICCRDDGGRTLPTKQMLQSQYLCSCRLLQWSAERLPIDRRSCAMRGMGFEEWHHACSMLISAGIITSQLLLEMPPSDALHQLRDYFDTLLGYRRNEVVSHRPIPYGCIAAN